MWLSAQQRYDVTLPQLLREHADAASTVQQREARRKRCPSQVARKERPPGRERRAGRRKWERRMATYKALPAEVLEVLEVSWYKVHGAVESELSFLMHGGKYRGYEDSDGNGGEHAARRTKSDTEASRLAPPSPMVSSAALALFSPPFVTARLGGAHSC